ncbi:MAG: hypothetical protein IKW39_05210, partial [Alphaproteobacteria bacterium]|nr:hypothetical protein [Alphaproteobacteria bacterium]
AVKEVKEPVVEVKEKVLPKEEVKDEVLKIESMVVSIKKLEGGREEIVIHTNDDILEDASLKEDIVEAEIKKLKEEVKNNESLNDVKNEIEVIENKIKNEASDVEVLQDGTIDLMKNIINRN